MKNNLEVFKENGKTIYDNKYDYSLIKNYINNKTTMKIICPEHGIFEKSYDKHINCKSGCPKCNKEKKSEDLDIINRFIKIHKNKYDYSLVIYKKMSLKVKIICPIHGIFKQEPSAHLKGNICPKCSGHFMNTEYFIEKSQKTHKNKYDYSLVDYKKSKNNVKIICPTHGVFELPAYKHIDGHGCKKCSKDEYRQRYFLDFLEKSREIHKNKYDYSIVDYITGSKRVKIICPIHGIFKQKPSDHKSGKGCSKCNESKGENQIRMYLDNKNIKYIRQYSFKNCRNINQLPFDFYLPDYNCCIEYDGQQHFKVIENWGGQEGFERRKENDKIKTDFCISNNIKLIRIKYNEKIVSKLNKNQI
jgi:very-short-patch-repair endonuclease